jgi:hypothetical protein
MDSKEGTMTREERVELAEALAQAADEHGTIQAWDMVALAPGQPELHCTHTMRSAARALGVEAEMDELFG